MHGERIAAVAEEHRFLFHAQRGERPLCAAVYHLVLQLSAQRFTLRRVCESTAQRGGALVGDRQVLALEQIFQRAGVARLQRGVHRRDELVRVVFVIHHCGRDAQACEDHGEHANGDEHFACGAVHAPAARSPAFSSRLVRAFAFSTARQAGQSSWSGFSSGLPQFLQVSIALPRVFLIFSRRRAAGVYSRA